MFLPFKNITTRQSAGYAVLCLVLAGGIKYMDAHMPEKDSLNATHDGLAWSDMDKQAAARDKKKQQV